jgi:hypothetical protein
MNEFVVFEVLNELYKARDKINNINYHNEVIGIRNNINMLSEIQLNNLNLYLLNRIDFSDKLLYIKFLNNLQNNDMIDMMAYTTYFIQHIRSFVNNMNNNNYEFI